MPKRRKGHKWWGCGKCLLQNAKICFAKIRKKEFIKKKNMYNINIFQISELCKRCNMFLIK